MINKTESGELINIGENEQVIPNFKKPYSSKMKGKRLSEGYLVSEGNEKRENSIVIDDNSDIDKKRIESSDGLPKRNNDDFCIKCLIM